ncbi:MAG TPA: YsnF/AvaK domain-containing protein [Clostridia bacterium]|nr:YsnF/AvaK domain-containing protein [Clostridia bacterium]
MKNFWGMFQDNDNNNEKETAEDGRLQLRQEELDVNKSRVQAGEVTLSKEVVEEQKAVDVPVTHEEVIIERRTINNESSDTPISSGETIRIPVSKEQVDVAKHTVVTGEVLARKHEVEETRHIEETLKKEEARINTEGDTNVVTDESTQDLS